MKMAVDISNEDIEINKKLDLMGLRSLNQLQRVNPQVNQLIY